MKGIGSIDLDITSIRDGITSVVLLPKQFSRINFWVYCPKRISKVGGCTTTIVPIISIKGSTILTSAKEKGVGRWRVTFCFVKLTIDNKFRHLVPNQCSSLKIMVYFWKCLCHDDNAKNSSCFITIKIVTCVSRSKSYRLNWKSYKDWRGVLSFLITSLSTTTTISQSSKNNDEAF